MVPQFWKTGHRNLLITILENLLSILKKHVHRRQPKNQEELWEFAEEEFLKIPLDYLQNNLSQFLSD